MAVGSMVVENDLVFASGGWPQKVTVCIRPATSEIVWHNNAATYIPSMLANAGHLYAVTNNGVAYCWKSETGEEMWKSRLGGNFSSSLVLVGDHLLVPNEGGVTKVFKAQSDKLEVVAENKLPGLTRATPTVCGDRIYIRTAAGLFCIGKS